MNPKTQKNSHYETWELERIARLCKEEETLDNLAHDYYWNPAICVKIAGNCCTNKSTLNYLSRSIYADVRVAVAERGAILSEKASLILSLDKVPQVKESLSRTTKYEPVMKHLLKNNAENIIIIGNVFKRLKNVEFINDFIKSASDVILSKILKNPDLTQEQLLAILDVQIKRLSVSVKSYVNHPRCTKEVFEKVITSVNLENLTDTEVIAILENQFALDYESNVKEIININNSKIIIQTVLSNVDITPELVYEIIENNLQVIVSDFNLAKLAITKTVSSEQKIALLSSIAYFDKELVNLLINSCTGTKEIIEMFISKIRNTDIDSVKALISSPKVNEEMLHLIVQKAIINMSVKNKNIIIAVLNKPACSLKTLKIITNVNSFEYITNVIVHTNCSLELRKEIFAKVKKTSKFTAYEKEQIFSLCIEYGGEDFINYVLNEFTSNSRELYTLYMYTNSLEIKNKIVERVNNRDVLKLITSSAILNKEDEVLKLAIHNPSISKINLRHIFFNSENNEIKTELAKMIKWTNPEKKARIKEGFLLED